MRIVGGIYRGRNLVPFDCDKIRPTSDKVRESVFNILQFRISGASFLDLFGGTGAMGIEALSRGAEKVVINDLNRESLSVAKKNIEKIGNPDRIKTVNFDAVKFLENSVEKFDVIFIDPPYKSDLAVKSLSVSTNALKDDGIVILESEEEFTEEIDGLSVYDKRKYGRARITIFKRDNKV